MDTKVWRNSMNLFRGSEYNQLFKVNKREPLTFYDMNLSAQDHQTFFTCVGDQDLEDLNIMLEAWRERDPQQRLRLAHKALEKNPECTQAYILLAEEEAKTIWEAEKIFLKALKFAENQVLILKKQIQLLYSKDNDNDYDEISDFINPYHYNYNINHINQQQKSINNNLLEIKYRRNLNVLIYIKRRLAMCYRKLGKLKESIKLMRDLLKEYPLNNLFNIHENLLEALLEIQAYSDAQTLLAKYDDINLPKSAVICYTSALLKSRFIGGEKFQSDTILKRGLTIQELQAIEAIHRAVEFNPHVPKYLLEEKSLILPPEHLLKRGDSEAIAYAFFHLKHWKRLDGALNLLDCTWKGTFRMIPTPLEKGHLFFPYLTCTECTDRELLPEYHILSVYPPKKLPFFVKFTLMFCTLTTFLTFIFYQYPEQIVFGMHKIYKFSKQSSQILTEILEYFIPDWLIQLLNMNNFWN